MTSENTRGGTSSSGTGSPNCRSASSPPAAAIRGGERSVGGIESDLVRDEVKIGSALIGVAAKFAAGALDPKLRAQVPRRHQARRRWIFGVNHQAELVLPASRAAECIELVLPQDVSGKTVGIETSLALRVGYHVNLAVRLLERLSNVMLVEPGPPGHDIRDGRLERVPERDRRILV